MSRYVTIKLLTFELERAEDLYCTVTCCYSKLLLDLMLQIPEQTVDLLFS